MKEVDEMERKRMRKSDAGVKMDKVCRLAWNTAQRLNVYKVMAYHFT
jgi:hypothetical protein